MRFHRHILKLQSIKIETPPYDKDMGEMQLAKYECECGLKHQYYLGLENVAPSILHVKEMPN